MITTSTFTGIKEIKGFVSLVFYLSNGDYAAGSLRATVRDLNISGLIQVTGCYVKGRTAPGATALALETLQARPVNGRGSRTQGIILGWAVGSPDDQPLTPTAPFVCLFLTTAVLSVPTELCEYQEPHRGPNQPWQAAGRCPTGTLSQGAPAAHSLYFWSLSEALTQKKITPPKGLTLSFYWILRSRNRWCQEI